jgi:alkanesulfonate monooxygenase SsuD/methylene tetrahydromethanopterin reductase-like flavin-dependent oxidoreductase (luciferase family)
MPALVSIGVAGGLGPRTIARIAAAAEAAGFHGLWVNDTPGGDSIAALSAAAAVTSTLTLATGVVPMDRRPASTIAATARDLPQDRTVLGIGVGGARSGSLALMRASIDALREAISARILVGALGPRMRELAAKDADGPLLSWLTPAAAAAQADSAHVIRPSAHVALYVRTALDDAARLRLDEEADRYASYPAYAANFARLGFAASDTVIVPDAASDGIRGYRAAVDELVLRAITPTDDVAAYERFVAGAAALLA